MNSRNATYTIGTAGHVDHGKSTLVEALTGIHPDRLAEEQARGMTIDLGFAWLSLPSGREVSVVDVPGHERFVHNMLAGVGGIDAVLFVIAADEGVMPQTREHLDIVTLLGVANGVVAITKTDLVDDEWMELVEAEVRDTLAGTPLADAPLVRVSVPAARGLDELRSAIDGVLDGVAARQDDGRPRLPIDRSFSMTGFGTVVTGTLLGGRLGVGAEVGIYPGARRVRVRGLQSHQSAVRQATPGRRVAVNLRGVGVDQVPRGSTLAAPGAVAETRRVDALFRLLPNAPRALKPGERVAWHSGTAEAVASLRYLEAEAVAPGGEGWVQWRLAEPVALAKGDPYVVRRLSPPLTIGGGTIVRTGTRRIARGDDTALERLAIAASAAPASLIVSTVQADGPISRAEITRRTELDPDQANHEIERLLEQGRLEPLGEALLVREAAEALRQQALEAIGDHHRRQPAGAGPDRTALRRALDVPNHVLVALLDGLETEGRVVSRGSRVGLANHQVELSASEEAAAKRLLALLEAGGAAPPVLAEAAKSSGASEALLSALSAQGRLVILTPEIGFSARTFEHWLAGLNALFAERSQITVADVRDLFQTTRKYALAFLEYLDGQSITRRLGDARVLIDRQDQAGAPPAG